MWQLTKKTESEIKPYFTNPFNDKIRIEIETVKLSNLLLIVMDLSGKIIYSKKDVLKPAGVNIVELDTLELTNGIYLYKLMAGKQYYSGKLVKTIL